MKYTDKDIQQAIELSQYAANKCSELEDYSIERWKNSCFVYNGNAV